MFVSGLERVVFGGVGEGGPRLFIGGCFDAVSVGDLCVEIFFGGDPSDCSDGFGLGQVIMMARNTFNPSLVFFTIALIGLLGFLSDWILRMVQKRILYWVPETTGVLRGL